MENRRSRKIVNFAVQGRIIVLVLLGIILTTVMLSGFIWFCLGTVETLATSNPYVDYDAISANVRYFSILSFLGILIVAIFLILLAIRMSHRMAGPIFRIKKEMDQMRSSGQINIIYVRSDDFHQDAVRSINQFLLYCRKKIRGETPLEELEQDSIE